MEAIKLLHHGHRKRLRERFNSAPIRTLPDYEILEMVLFYAIPRGDTKIIAKRLLAKFRSLSGVLNAEAADIEMVDGVGEGASTLLKLLLDLNSRLALPLENKDLQVLNNFPTVLSYLKLTVGFRKTECFKVLYLNRKNILIADEVFDGGTVDKVQIYPREIVKRALGHNASAVILVHNHPSGDCSPSKEDLDVTKEIKTALNLVSINLHDHIIIAENKHYSFRNTGLI